MIQHIMDWYRPGAVVLQCGADSLAGDKLGCFNLSMRGHAACVSFMQTFEVPLICVGGGGYTVRNVARTWTYETALLLGRQPDEDLPFNEYMGWFGPEYKLDVRPTSMENLNSEAYLEGLRSRVIDNLRCLPFAPSVQLQPTPKYSLNAHAEGDLSDASDEGEGGELDKKVRQALRRAELRQQLESHQSGSDSDGQEEEEQNGHAGGHSTRPLKRDPSSSSFSRQGLNGLLWNGNRALDERQRHRAGVFNREGSTTSSLASKSWLSNGYKVTGHNEGSGSLGGPPEALRRILANKLAADRRARPPMLRQATGISRQESDAEMESEVEDSEMEDDMDSDREGLGGPSEAGSRSYGPTRLTKTGRPRRSFFDSARPFRPWSSDVLGQHTSSAPGVLTNGSAADVARMEIDTVVALDAHADMEREKELERGRRGEGGGSESAVPVR